MTQTYTEDVFIDGSEDEVQLRVQGSAGQSEVLQTWEKDGDQVVAQIGADGRIQAGDIASTSSAIVEAHRNTSSNLPERGISTFGLLSSFLSGAISWLLSELEINSPDSFAGIFRALQSKISFTSAGDASDADLRAGEFHAVNNSGSSGLPVKRMSGIQALVDNQSDAHLADANGVSVLVHNLSNAEINTIRGIEVQDPLNEGTITTLVGVDVADMDAGQENYAIRTGTGIVHLGDVLELEQLTNDPVDKADVVQFYGKDNKIFAKAPDPDNTVYDLTQGVGGGGSAEGNGTMIATVAAFALNARDYVCILPGSDYAQPLPNAGYLVNNIICGFVTETVAANDPVIIQLAGIMGGFSGLTPGRLVYLDPVTPGITQTQPTPAWDADQIIAPLGMAVSETEIHIRAFPLQYQTRLSLQQGDEISLLHRIDDGERRHVRAYLNELLVDTALISYGDSNLDSNVSLRAQIVSTYGLDQCNNGTVSSSSDTYGDDTNAFDPSDTTVWGTEVTAHPHWIEYDFGADKTIRQYTMRAATSYVGRTPGDWQLQYWDGTTWQVADSQSNITWAAGQQRVFYVENAYTAQRWRIYVTDNWTNNVNTRIANIEMMEAATYADGADKLAQTFNLVASTEIGVIGLRLKKIGNPTGTLTVRIETTSAGEPTGTLAHPDASATIPEASLNENYSDHLIAFVNSFTLTAGDYAIVLGTDRSASASDYVQWGADESSPAFSGGEMFSETSAIWSAESKDAIFAIYAPGILRRSQLAVDSWQSTNADLVNRFGDENGTDLEIYTTFKCTRADGFADVTLVVELD